MLVLQFELDKWKFSDGTQAVLYSKVTRCAMRITGDGAIDALAISGPTDPDSK